MQQGDYNSYYHQYPQFPNPSSIPNSNPNPNPSPPAPPAVSAPTNTYASAPPFTGGYGNADYSSYSQNYPSYGQSTDHVPPSAPVQQPPLPSPPATSLNPNSYPNFNQPPTNHPPPLSSYGSFDSSAPYQQSTTQPTYYPPYDQHQSSGYSHAPPSSAASPSPNPSSYSSSLYSAPPYSSGGSSMPPSYEKSYDKPKFDQSLYGGYGSSRSDVGSDLYGKRTESGGGYPSYDDSYGDGVYAYQGGKVEPYGSRGTAPKSSNSTLFDDYGRSISFSSGGRDSSTANSGSAKIVRAVPKADVQEDATGGVQKFRVKLLAETYGQTTTDVLCQVLCPV